MENKKQKANNTSTNAETVDSQFLTPKQAAIKLQVTAEQIRSLIRQGRLEAVNIGTGSKRPLYRISKTKLEEFINRPFKLKIKAKRTYHKKLQPVPDFFSDID
jgi:excisionase family DNA binding protein